jgi:catechol 2,3-dioxygenase-like lactoylglutathione lyase family enzyme
VLQLPSHYTIFNIKIETEEEAGIMKYSGTLLCVRDIKRAKAFYEELFGCEVGMDLGVHVAFTNGIFLQEEKSWMEFIQKGEDALIFGGNDKELYFDTHDLDAFVEKLLARQVALVHPLKEHGWGQRVIRFYDPDQHIIEVGEHLGDVARRFMATGMTLEETAQRMDVPIEMLSTFLAE